MQILIIKHTMPLIKIILIFLIKVLPATQFKTWDADGAVKLYIEEEGAMSGAPFSVHTLMQDRARDYGKHPALAVKREGAWR